MVVAHAQRGPSAVLHQTGAGPASSLQALTSVYLLVFSAWMLIFAALLPAILELVPQLIGIFGKGERGKTNAAAAQAVTDALTKATGAPNLQGAIEAMQADSAAKAAGSDQSGLKRISSALAPCNCASVL